MPIVSVLQKRHRIITKPQVWMTKMKSRRIIPQGNTSVTILFIVLFLAVMVCLAGTGFRLRLQ